MASSNPFIGSKRKCEDSDAVVELFSGVSISPSAKKLRQDFGSTSYPNEFPSHAFPYTGSSVACPPDLELSELASHNPPLCPPDVHLPEQLSEVCPANDERALVLYKPVNPPLFPGGPSAGSQLRLSSTILSSGILDSLTLLRKKREEQLSWLQPSSNGDRAPYDLERIEESAPQSGPADRLAVVPWVSHSFMNMLPSQTAVKNATEDVDMCGDAQAMEDDTRLNGEAVNMLNNSGDSFCYEPWQQYVVPQSQYGSLMWSH